MRKFESRDDRAVASMRNSIHLIQGTVTASIRTEAQRLPQSRVSVILAMHRLGLPYAMS